MDSELLNDIVAYIQNHYFGKYRGVVTDNADPDSRARVKVRVPAVLQNVEVWAMPCVPYAGNQVGFYSLPEPGAGIWVEFEGGNLSFPIWTGCFWGDNELPDNNDANIKIWKTNSLTMRVDDAADELKFETTSGSTLTLSDSIESLVSGSSHTVSSSDIVSESGGGKIEVGPGTVNVNSGALEIL